MQTFAEKKKLILTLAAFFPDSYGGAERQALILAEAFARQGVDVTLVAPTKDKQVSLVEDTDFGRIIRKRVIAYPNFGGRHIASFISWSLWFLWKFSGPQWRGVPVYCFHARLHALGPALAASQNRAPLLIKLGGGGEASEFYALRVKKYFYGHWVEALLRQRVDCFVANSHQIASELRDLGIIESRIAEFPNGVVLPDEEWMLEAQNKRKGQRFIYAARLNPDKNVNVLYEAAVQVAHSGCDLTMRLVGEGTEKDRLLPKSEVFDGCNTVQFPGFSSDIYAELKEADFFISASVREGQSNAMLEAMSAGLIPIVAPASGVHEVIEHGVTGFIVPDTRIESFAAVIELALSMSADERQAMSRLIYSRVQNTLSIDAVARKTLSAIECRLQR